MDKIHYAGDIVYTGTDISRALLEYARVLAQKGSSATVEIPVYHADGSRGTSEFLVGPASQVVADSIETDWEEIVDKATVDFLKAATSATVGTNAVAFDASAESSEPTFPDFGDL